ncbi:serine/threonine-protein kinase ZRK1-like [Lycium barbarum]|uniref:serine/threonine-protein kinase ZRK1-like n=1 Tax=Lycium barbarum TaxID=112863 RepID=UPI00293E6526|nr:serine/threonine-protein kinase ZRK1-like [Lycium barbarum]
MQFFRRLTRKKVVSSATAERKKKEQDYYLKNGSAVLEELLALCEGNCRIPIRYFSVTEIERAIKHSENKLELSDGYMVTGSLDKRLVLVRFNTHCFNIIHRDIAVTAQMSHLKNVLRLVGCCLEFESPVMVYEYVEGISLRDLLFEKGNHDDQTRRSLLSWGNRLRIANQVASAVVFLHTEFTTPIIHRDIKPHKVIIDQNSGVAKMVDFSFSISLPPGKMEVQAGFPGTTGYIAPEYGRHDIVTQKIDVYSFGVLLFELLTGESVPDIMDRMAIPKGLIYLENLSPNIVDRYFKEGNVIYIADPAILEERGIEIQQQLEDYLDLVKKCTAYKGENRPYMIHVAKELRRIENCFRALTIGHIYVRHNK